ncbi:MAG: class A beta-lactamase-related serine hydrolase [Bacteroidia bacterium]|nr:class A beta-lactamase-related serine hydrolase [Bacteroidia bacterium]
MKRINNNKSLFIIFTSIVLFFNITTFLFDIFYLDKKEDNNSENNKNISSECKDYKLKRLSGYKYAMPLMFVDNSCQSEKLFYLKNEINNLFNKYKELGVLNSASLYLKDYNSNGWIAINESETYSPGSLLKVPAMITLLKMSEKNPGFLNKKIVFNKKYDVQINPTYLSKTIKFGETYTVKELMSYMIKYSDNNATLLLNEVIDVKVFKQLFKDFGLKEFDWNGSDYLMTVTDYSEFLPALFNASYLNIENSDFALELLSKSDFKEGFSKGIPANVNVAEKFGESGNLDMKELHETAIVFLANKPYIITIMTKGKELEKLPEVLKEASYLAYNHLNQLSY